MSSTSVREFDPMRRGIPSRQRLIVVSSYYRAVYTSAGQVSTLVTAAPLAFRYLPSAANARSARNLRDSSGPLHHMS